MQNNLPDQENSKGRSSSKRMKGKSKFSREDELMKARLDTVIDATKICAAEIEKMNQKPIFKYEI